MTSPKGQSNRVSAPILDLEWSKLTREIEIRRGLLARSFLKVKDLNLQRIYFRKVTRRLIVSIGIIKKITLIVVKKITLIGPKPTTSFKKHDSLIKTVIGSII